MNRSLFELETGILIFGIAGQLILFFFAGRGLYSAAWWIGIATAAVCAVDMWWALDRGLDLGRQGAAKKIMVHYMIRYDDCDCARNCGIDGYIESPDYLCGSHGT